MSRRNKRELRKTAKRSLKTLGKLWIADKAPLFRFALKFCGVMVLFYLLSPVPLCHEILSASVSGTAQLSSAILNGIGESTHVTDGTIWSAKYAITVLPACTGIEFSMFFCAMVISFPSRLSRKIPGILVGVTLLLALNLFRIVSLYYIGVHFHRYFDTAHEELWGIPLIIASVFLLAVWIGWAQQDNHFEPNVA